ncbi:hypothetical protein [Arthrobacter bambusae]|uniref:hypothetical protein n=1 Tax=Arthrobacter bambusae TaxID=1338426 RepID=UPI00277D23C6|nr:hypothetical protein [Arthrobacter bambusae]MDQ0028799.1 hypothetical protein [Arthrobacter bambusae]MDQ0096407.1 hypothetical protein [Arthrobacter bambusae]
MGQEPCFILGLLARGELDPTARIVLITAVSMAEKINPWLFLIVFGDLPFACIVLIQ